MIISHKYKYIFLKTRKTAGSSVEMALAAHCGPEDVVTPMRSEGRPGQNNTIPHANLSVRDKVKALIKGAPSFHEHSSAKDAKRWIDSEIWRSYFKFTIERNPWSRYVSQYFWNTRVGGEAEGMSLQDHFEWCAPWRKSNWDIYAIDDQVVVDLVIPYENLEANLARVTAKLGIPDLDLPQAKSKHRRKSQHYSEVLPRDLVDKIAEVCAHEISSLGYKFEGDQK